MSCWSLICSPGCRRYSFRLKAMLNGDGAMVEALAGFVHRLQDSLYSRRRESQAGIVLAAMIELHKEQVEELTSKSIAEKANQMNEEAQPLTSEKVGWLTRQLGLEKKRVAGSGRRIICWDEEKIGHLAKRYGLSTDFSLSQENLSQPSHLSQTSVAPACDSICDSSIGSGELSQGFEANCDGCDSSEGFLADMKEKLGMTVEEALGIWATEGKPIIYLGPGENCFGPGQTA